MGDIDVTLRFHDPDDLDRLAAVYGWTETIPVRNDEGDEMHGTDGEPLREDNPESASDWVQRIVGEQLSEAANRQHQLAEATQETAERMRASRR